MKIALTGTHGVGKTTLVEALREQYYFKDYFFDVNVTRWVRSLGFPINEIASDASQEINMIKRVAHLNTHDNLIADRSLFDIYAYSYYSWKNGTLSAESLNYQRDLLIHNIDKYDLVILLKPEFELEMDGTRSDSKQFQNDIHDIILHTINELNYNSIVRATGTVEQRVNNVVTTYKFVKSIKEKNASTYRI